MAHSLARAASRCRGTTATTCRAARPTTGTPLTGESARRDALHHFVTTGPGRRKGGAIADRLGSPVRPLKAASCARPWAGRTGGPLFFLAEVPHPNDPLAQRRRVGAAHSVQAAELG